MLVLESFDLKVTAKVTVTCSVNEELSLDSAASVLVFNKDRLNILTVGNDTCVICMEIDLNTALLKHCVKLTLQLNGIEYVRFSVVSTVYGMVSLVHASESFFGKTGNDLLLSIS